MNSARFGKIMKEKKYIDKKQFPCAIIVKTKKFHAITQLIIQIFILYIFYHCPSKMVVLHVSKNIHVTI